jgi:N-acetylglutamate synthase-like GNAT family acetyltransferase
MTLPTECKVRRATLDDIEQLTALWTLMRFPADDLARRITEFQVCEGSEGRVVGAVGLQIVQKQGLIHSEGFLDFSLADALRPMLWERLRSLAGNHGLTRFWTADPAPFWSQNGLQKATAQELEKLPAGWRPSGREWLTLKLREDLETVMSADREFALFMESEKERSRRAIQQAKVLKYIATLLAVALFAAVLLAAFFLLRKNPAMLGR